YQPGFTAELMLKDLTLALNAAQTASLDLSSAKAVAPRYQQLIDQGRSGLDFSAIFTNIE
ncbi:MAG: NAD-binding protein, partial [Pseudomonadota bacterium]